MGMSEGDVLISKQRGSFGSEMQTIVLCAMRMANSSLEQQHDVASRSRRSIRFAD